MEHRRVDRAKMIVSDLKMISDLPESGRKTRTGSRTVFMPFPAMYLQSSSCIHVSQCCSSIPFALAYGPSAIHFSITNHAPGSTVYDLVLVELFLGVFSYEFADLQHGWIVERVAKAFRSGLYALREMMSWVEWSQWPFAVQARLYIERKVDRSVPVALLVTDKSYADIGGLLSFTRTSRQAAGCSHVTAIANQYNKGLPCIKFRLIHTQPRWPLISVSSTLQTRVLALTFASLENGVFIPKPNEFFRIGCPKADKADAVMVAIPPPWGALTLLRSPTSVPDEKDWELFSLVSRAPGEYALKAKATTIGYLGMLDHGKGLTMVTRYYFLTDEEETRAW